MFTKSDQYRYDRSAIVDPNGRNKRSVWDINTFPYAGAHFATFPPKLVEPCIRSCTRPGDFVLDPFFGSGTTGLVAGALGRRYVGIEINPEFIVLAKAPWSRLRTGRQNCRMTFNLPPRDLQASFALKLAEAWLLYGYSQKLF